MQHIDLSDHGDAWRVLAGTARSQAAIMTLPPGEDTGSPGGSEHPEADQWLIVLSGTGEAEGVGWRQPLGPGSLLLVVAGEGHRISATGTEPLRTLNLYAPPHYDPED